MAKAKLSNATLQFFKTEDTTFVRFPIGTSGSYIPPTNPETDTDYTITFPEEWEFEYDDEVELKDSSSPSIVAYEFIGGRPKSTR